MWIYLQNRIPIRGETVTSTARDVCVIALLVTLGFEVRAITYSELTSITHWEVIELVENSISRVLMLPEFMIFISYIT